MNQYKNAWGSIYKCVDFQSIVLKYNSSNIKDATNYYFGFCRYSAGNDTKWYALIKISGSINIFSVTDPLVIVVHDTAIKTSRLWTAVIKVPAYSLIEQFHNHTMYMK